MNVEDVRIDHATGHRLGSLDIMVLPDREQDLVVGLQQRGWRLPEHPEPDEAQATSTTVEDGSAG